MLKQFGQQSVNRKKSKASKQECCRAPHFTFHAPRFTVLSAVLLTDQSLCKDTFGSSTHLVDDLTEKEQTYAAQD